MKILMQIIYHELHNFISNSQQRRCADCTSFCSKTHILNNYFNFSTLALHVLQISVDVHILLTQPHIFVQV